MLDRHFWLARICQNPFRLVYNPVRQGSGSATGEEHVKKLKQVNRLSMQLQLVSLSLPSSGRHTRICSRVHIPTSKPMHSKAHVVAG